MPRHRPGPVGRRLRATVRAASGPIRVEAAGYRAIHSMERILERHGEAAEYRIRLASGSGNAVLGVERTLARSQKSTISRIPRIKDSNLEAWPGKAM